MGVDLKTAVPDDLTEDGGETFLVGVMDDLPADELTDLAGLRLLRAQRGSWNSGRSLSSYRDIRERRVRRENTPLRGSH